MLPPRFALRFLSLSVPQFLVLSLPLSLLFWLYVIKTSWQSQKASQLFSFLARVPLHCVQERERLITIHNSPTLNRLQPSR